MQSVIEMTECSEIVGICNAAMLMMGRIAMPEYNHRSFLFVCLYTAFPLNAGLNTKILQNNYVQNSKEGAIATREHISPSP